MKVKKNSLVKLSYKTYVEGKLVDSSEIHKPLEVVYGVTELSKEMETKIKDKEKGFKFSLKQKVDSEPVRAEYPLSTFDETTIEMMKKDKEIELELNKFWYPFKVIEIDEDAEVVILEYEDPFAGKEVVHEITIVDVSELKVDKDAKKEKS